MFLLFSTRQDGVVVLHVLEDYDSILETVFKTEFLTLLSKTYEDVTNSKLRINFEDRWVIVAASYRAIPTYFSADKWYPLGINLLNIFQTP